MHSWSATQPLQQPLQVKVKRSAQNGTWLASTKQRREADCPSGRCTSGPVQLFCRFVQPWALGADGSL
jgi:hypothetical protein